MARGCARCYARRLQFRPDLVVEILLVMLATKTTTASTSPAAVDAFIDALKSPELTAILAETGLKRPDGFPSP